MIGMLFRVALMIIASVGLYFVIDTRAYIVLAIGAFMIIALILYSRHGLVHNDESAPGPIWILVTMLLSALLGVLWPGTALALAVRKIDERGKPKADEGHLGIPVVERGPRKGHPRAITVDESDEDR